MLLVLGCCLALIPFYVEASSDEWDIFTFTQEWPTAVCEMAKREHHTCAIPRGVVGWGIHGLWPTKKGTHGPQSCNTGLRFDANKLRPIQSALERSWPNMFADTSTTSFWEHEWSKHGTCAASLPATANEYMYFQKALTIMDKYNATKLLANANITPSTTRTYTLNEVSSALTRQLGATPLVECTKDYSSGKDMLYEVEICLDKQFNPIDCYQHSGNSDNIPDGNCPHSGGIEYPPLNNETTTATHSSEPSSNEWDIFTFTQEWPVAVCETAKREHHRCVIPRGVFGWGIHGLWPTKKGTHGPHSCNTGLRFDANKLRPLQSALERSWPNMFADTSTTSFWEHEWSKHGTCAASLPATGNEFLYFQKALTLMEKFTASKLLAKENILPSATRTYTLNEVTLALTRQIGAKPFVECTKDYSTGKDMLFEVEVCLDKQFNPIDCYELSANGSSDYNPESNCPHSGGIEYPPLNNESDTSTVG